MNQLSDWPLYRCELLLSFQPLSDEVARGLVTEYRIHIGYNAKQRSLYFNASDDWIIWRNWLNLSSFRQDEEYLINIDARTKKGYNNKLELDVIHIPKSSDCKFVLLFSDYTRIVSMVKKVCLEF
jgi:hypothetical protein